MAISDTLTPCPETWQVYKPLQATLCSTIGTYPVLGGTNKAGSIFNQFTTAQKEYKISVPHHSVQVTLQFYFIGSSTGSINIAVNNLIVSSLTLSTLLILPSTPTKILTAQPTIYQQQVSFTVTHNTNSFILRIGSTSSSWGIGALTLTSQDCSSNCLLCGSSTSCKSCAVGYYVNFDIQSSFWGCAATCPIESLISDGICIRQCPPPDFLNVNCKHCPEGKVLQSGSCVDQCSTGYYLISTTGYCEQCSLGCPSCQSGSFCDGPCLAPRIHLEGFCVCPPHTYELATSDCFPCPNNCDKCSGGLCNKCLQPYQLNSDGFCVQPTTCPIGCATCQGSPTTCTSCNSGTGLFNGECVSQCPIATFLDVTANVCQNCPMNCQYCLIYGCFQCFQGHYADEYQQCSPCKPECINCWNADECSSCPEGKVLQSGSCVDKCSTGYYLGSTNQYCQQCSFGCTSCHSGDFCDGPCLAPRTPQSGYCICPPHTYEEETADCFPCPANCDKCPGGLCNKCLYPYQLNSDGFCVQL